MAENDNPKKAPLSEEQKRLLWEFEGWLMENKIGFPNDGRSLPIPREFDPNTMMVHHVRWPETGTDRLFVLQLDEIPRKYLRAI